MRLVCIRGNKIPHESVSINEGTPRAHKAEKKLRWNSARERPTRRDQEVANRQTIALVIDVAAARREFGCDSGSPDGSIWQ